MPPLLQPSLLPQIIAALNLTSFLLLLAGFVAVKSGRILLHRLCMGMALLSSVAFLAVYLLHHYQVGTVLYPRHDWTHILYLVILIPHVILAVAILPFVFLAVKHALKNEIEKHKRVVRYLFPVWIYVSFTGLVVYFMLYHLN